MIFSLPGFFFYIFYVDFVYIKNVDKTCRMEFMKKKRLVSNDTERLLFRRMCFIAAGNNRLYDPEIEFLTADLERIVVYKIGMFGG